VLAQRTEEQVNVAYIKALNCAFEAQPGAEKFMSLRAPDDRQVNTPLFEAASRDKNGMSRFKRSL